MTVSILVIGPPGRLRDGLHTILRTFSAVTDVFAASDFETGYKVAARTQPSLVIVDGKDFLANDCFLLKQLLSRNGIGRCVAIANTMKQAVQAEQVGADAVLLQGFSTSTLLQTLISLDVIPDEGDSNKVAAPSRQKEAAVPLARRN